MSAGHHLTIMMRLYIPFDLAAVIRLVMITFGHHECLPFYQASVLLEDQSILRTSHFVSGDRNLAELLETCFGLPDTFSLRLQSPLLRGLVNHI